MNFDTFIELVQRRAGIGSTAEAYEIIEATFLALGGCLNDSEAKKLASQLPKELADVLRDGDEGLEYTSLRELFETIARRAGIQAGAAEAGARAVMSVLEDAMAGEPIEQLRAALPHNFSVLFQGGKAPTAHPPAV